MNSNTVYAIGTSWIYEPSDVFMCSRMWKLDAVRSCFDLHNKFHSATLCTWSWPTWM